MFQKVSTTRSSHRRDDRVSSFHPTPGRTLASALAISFALVLLVAGCHSTPESPAPPATSSASAKDSQWPGKLADFRFRWSAEPGFDLAVGWAVPLRAYLESWLLTRYTDNAFDGYPGFVGATPAPLEPGSSELIDLPYEQRQIPESRGASEYQDPDLRIVGNEDLHVLRTDPIPSGFRALVCDSTLNVYKQAAGATQFAPLTLQSQVSPTDADNMKVWRIEFSDHDPRADSNQPDAGKPQQGPLPAPLTDVFGNWFVTGREGVAGWSNDGRARTDTRQPGRSPANPRLLERRG